MCLGNVLLWWPVFFGIVVNFIRVLVKREFAIVCSKQWNMNSDSRRARSGGLEAGEWERWGIGARGRVAVVQRTGVSE
jgi:hypothetical protein